MTPNVVNSCTVWLPQTQTWIYNQVDQLQRLGFKTSVVCERIENLKQFEVANIYSLGKEPILVRFCERLLRKLGLRHRWNYLAEKSRKTCANIVHSHFGPVGWDNLEAVRKLGVKHVVTFYGYDLSRLPVQHPHWQKRYLQLFSEVDLVLCEGKHMAKCLQSLGCSIHKIRVQHLGVNVQTIEFQPRRWNQDEPIRILIAASFREKKGIPYAIGAIRKIAEKTPVSLTIIGDAGNDKESLEEKKKILSNLESSGLMKDTRLLGYQPHHTLLKEAYDHHIFLQPSITASNGDTEGGAPVSIIEMLATGMPVVSTSHCDIPEVLGSAFSHLLAPERDIAALAEHIQSLIDKPDSWLELVKKGREHIEQEYNLTLQAKHLVSLYNELV